jgi:hypothetical protein
MALGDITANRPSFLEQILLFVGDANGQELSAIRKDVAHRTNSRGFSGLIKGRGRPSIREDEARMYRARIAVWRRVIDGWPFEQIAAALKIKLRKNRFNSKGRIEIEGNADSVRLHLQRLEQYLAAALWRAMPPNYIRSSAAGSEIAPGALDDKRLQTTLEYGTGLPFRRYPEECKKIASELWPDASLADWELTKRHLSYLHKKRAPRP